MLRIVKICEKNTSRRQPVHETVDRRSIKINTIRQVRGPGVFNMVCFVLIRQAFVAVPEIRCDDL